MIKFYSFAKFSVSTVATAVIVIATSPMASAATDTDPCTQTGNTVTCTWDKPGSYTWDIPDNVTSVTFDVYGAQGGSAQGNSGGLGGRTMVPNMKVDYGLDAVQINVGGQGRSISGKPSGGFNGGGEASAVEGIAGAGGGGGSDVLIQHYSGYGLITAGGGGGAGVIGGGGAGGGTTADSAPKIFGHGGGGGATEKVESGEIMPIPGQGHSGLFCYGGYSGTFGYFSTRGDGDTLGHGGSGYSCVRGAGGGGGGWTGGAGGTEGAGGGGGIGNVSDSLKDYYDTVHQVTGVQQNDGKVVVTFTAP